MAQDEGREGAGQALTIYVLYLLGFLSGITVIIGVVMAYTARGDGEEWLDSHYQAQIRSFWVGLLWIVVGLATAIILIGIPILLLGAVWWIVRNVKGLRALDRREPIEDPESWSW